MKSNRSAQVGVPAAIVSIVAIMVVPLPTMVLDFLLVINLAAAVMILLATMFVQRALDFSVFPSVLLVATLFRLSLNVAAVRLVLLHGDAGRVIEAFGHVVIGGSVVVGLVVFLILVVIQFVVITNGAGRVAEVGARFTLDAMPGKQMAIDADLNAGAITEDEARIRRREVGAEADFYGAMDGASKFVKGDAIAAIIITVINLIGGFVVGVVQRGMSIGDAINHYSLLTVGDGLVSQIPALLISIASGLIVTRAATENDLGTDLLQQFGRHAKTAKIAAGALVAISLMPGLPKMPFWVVAAGLWVGATRASSTRAAEKAAAIQADVPPVRADSPTDLVGDMRIEPLELNIGYGLMDLVDANRGGDLLERVRALRRKTAMELGIVLPPVRTRDSMALSGNTYEIKVHGVAAGRGDAPPGVSLLLGPCPPHIPGQATTDPVFGMEAFWIPVEFASQAELSGSTVIDRGSVITTHLAEVIRTNASRLLSRQDVKLLVDGVRASDPAVTEELAAVSISLAEVQRVLQSLLDEGVAIRDLIRILEVLSERGRVTKDPEALVEAVRASLGPAISVPLADDARLSVITLDPLVERLLLEGLRSGDGGTFLTGDASTLERIVASIAALVEEVENRGVRPVIVCSGPLRPAMRKLVRSAAPDTPVLAYAELGSRLTIETVGVVQSDQLVLT